MKKNRVTILALVALLVTMTLIPTVSADSGGQRVDDDGVECPDATYTTIQAAVDAASPGDKIIVCAGTYFGATVNKAVTIKAEGDVVVNDGPNSHSFLRAGFLLPNDYSGSGASISGFRFVGAQQSGYTDDGKLDFPIFSRGANDVTIEGNVMVDSLQAITNWNGGGWKITENEIVDLWTLNGGGIGILVGASDGGGPYENNVISDNQIKGTLRVWSGDGGGYDGTGIVLYADFRWGRSGAIAVRQNRISDNEIRLVSDNPSVVDVNGIELTDTRGDPDSTVVYSNLVSDNKMKRIGRYGIMVTGAPGNHFTDNEIGNSGELDAFDDTAGSGTAGTANTWKDNDCDTSSPAGLCGEDDGGD